jgi:hypothetical protein
MSSLRKLGGFLILFGLFLLALFVFSDMANQPEFGLLLAGMGGTLLGIFILVTNPAPKADPNPRFRLVRGVKSQPQPKGPPSGDKPAPGGPPRGGGSGAAPKGSGGLPSKGGGKPGKK